MTIEPEKLYSRQLLELFRKIELENTAGEHTISVSNNSRNISTPFMLTGVDSQTAVSAATGEKIIIKGMVILASAINGKAYIRRGSDNTVLLPAYFNNFSRAATTGELNIRLNEAEDIIIETIDVGASAEVFFGISYFKVVV